MISVRFCSACGAELEFSPPTTCAACGTAHWLNPKPCANAVAVQGGRVLLVRRAHAPWREMWSTPGGFCNVGEHPIDAAVREAWEETGVHIAVTGYLGVWVDAYADDPTDASADVINVAYYLAVPTRAQPGTIDPAEVHEARWFDWNDLPVGLAPPGTLEAVLAAARIVHREADGLTPVYDRPRGLM